MKKIFAFIIFICSISVQSTVYAESTNGNISTFSNRMTQTNISSSNSFYDIFQKSPSSKEEEIREEVEKIIKKKDFLKNLFGLFETTLIDPVQEKAQDTLGLDVIRISNPRIQGILNFNIINFKDIPTLFWGSRLLDNTKIYLGKYVYQPVLLEYSVRFIEDIIIDNKFY
ncbi:MAG: hypothetical protein KKH98_10690, partial [Spirochaetes bacterium]|nr:hypothetical protein [Spirochaetota bacterium]